jgi:hypothetical protein
MAVQPSLPAVPVGGPQEVLDPRPMISARWRRLEGMNDLTQSPTTLSNIGVVMFTVADQDAALAF